MVVGDLQLGDGKVTLNHLAVLSSLTKNSKLVNNIFESAGKDQDSLVMFGVINLHPTILKRREIRCFDLLDVLDVFLIFSSSFKEVDSLTFLGFYENLTNFLGFV